MTPARGKKKLTNTTVDHLAAEEKVYEVRDTELKGFLVRVLPSGSKMFYLDYRINGKRNRYCIGASCQGLPVAKAREIAADKFGSIAKGVDVQVEKKQLKRQKSQEKYSTLEGLLDHKYGPWVEVHRKDGKATLRRIKATFNFLLTHRLDEIDSWTIEKWRTERLTQGINASTINRDLAALKAVLSKAIEWDVMPVHPLNKVKPSKLDAHKIIRFLSPDETTRLHAALENREEEIRSTRNRGNLWRLERGYHLFPSIPSVHYADHLHPMVVLALNTGIRRGELFDLHWRDVDFSQKNLTIRGESAKAGKTRHIPLNQTALGALQRWQKQTNGARDALLFTGKKGRLDNVNSAWGNLLEKAEITNFRWHDMRHDFASRLVMAGVDLNTVRELLGHSDLKMTLRYAHLAPEHKAAAVDKLVTERIQP